jgi:CRP/FNR family transcriptional regulator
VFPEDATIFAEGQSARGIFLLCEGQAKLSTTSREGRTFILRIAKAGEMLGLHAIITGKPYELTVETMQPSRLTFVERNDFLRFLRGHNDACLQTARQISRDCQDAYEVVRSLGLTPFGFEQDCEVPAGNGMRRNGAEWDGAGDILAHP